MEPALIIGAVAVVALSLVAILWARRRVGPSVRRTAALPRRLLEPKVVEIRDDPDEPQGFGYKSLWIAARAPSARSLAEALALSDLRISNWQSGLEAAYAYPSDYVFVTPPMAGWTLAVGVGLPDPSDPALLPRWRSLMSGVSQLFGEAWFFASHRVTSYSAWARYSAGAEQRLFAYADGQLIYSFGEPAGEEADLVKGLSTSADTEAVPADEEEFREPDEEDVLRLAGAWTLDPSTIESLGLPVSVGLVGRMPHQAG